MATNRFGRICTVAAALLMLGGCDNLLDVSDPQNFTDEDLDLALDAVANGVEGELHGSYDNLVYFSALLGDEWQHTGTWSGWDDVDHGRVRYAQSPVDGTFDGLLRARFASQDAQERFTRVLEAGASSSPLMAQVMTVEGLVDLILAEHFCEAPQGPGGAAISDAQMYQQAITKLQAAQVVATASGPRRGIDYALVAQAGIARAHLMLGNFSQAATAAQAVPTSFTYEAIYTSSAVRNDIVFLATVGFNNAGGMREKWWSAVDVPGRKLRDPWTSELDGRVGIRNDAGVLGVDGITPYFSQWKYTGLASRIEIVGGREMRLIEAEVHWRNNAFPQAMAVLNALRADAGLSSVANPGTSAGVFDILLSERFAENFMEGHRTNDLYRFNLFGPMVAAGAFNSPTTGGTSIAQRAIKFPLSDNEASANPNIADDVAQRCSPTLP